MNELVVHKDRLKVAHVVVNGEIKKILRRIIICLWIYAKHIIQHRTIVDLIRRDVIWAFKLVPGKNSQDGTK